MSEFYTFREMRFKTQQMVWLAENIETLRSGTWPTEPPNYVEHWSPGKRQKGKMNKFGRPARFEKPSQIAAEFDWRLAQCWDREGTYGEMFIDIYGRKLTYETSAKKHNVTADIVDLRVRQILG